MESVTFRMFKVCVMIHVFLVALRDIKEGELLMYDYNGLEKNYPTDHFV